MTQEFGERNKLHVTCYMLHKVCCATLRNLLQKVDSDFTLCATLKNSVARGGVTRRNHACNLQQTFQRLQSNM